MTHDPMRQADIARRLANLAKAPRCGAKTRSGYPFRGHKETHALQHSWEDSTGENLRGG